MQKLYHNNLLPRIPRIMASCTSEILHSWPACLEPGHEHRAEEFRFDNLPNKGGCTLLIGTNEYGFKGFVRVPSCVSQATGFEAGSSGLGNLVCEAAGACQVKPLCGIRNAVQNISSHVV